MLFKNKQHVFIIILCMVLLFTACNQSGASSASSNDDTLSVLFINVGKADATLVSYGNSNYLIDTGYDSSLTRLIKALKTLEIDMLDGVFITHAHNDHIGGLEGLLELVDVNVIYVHKITDFDNKDGENEVAELANKHNIHFVELNTGDDVFISERNKDIKLTVVGPVVKNYDNENDNSLVMQIKHQGQSILFAGDMQYAEEASLSDANLLEKFNVLKVGNHGNDDATSLEFAKAIMPDIAVVTTSKDILSSDTSTKAIDNLKSVDAEIYSTRDSNMGVLVKVDKEGVDVSQLDFANADLNTQIMIADIDHLSELVTIHNYGDTDVDLLGWWMESTKGNEVFYFPSGAKLKAGGDLLIASGGYEGYADLYWDDKNVWKDKKEDKAILYDVNGNYVDSYTTPKGKN